MVKRGKVIAVLMLAVLVMGVFFAVRAQAMDTRPTIPSETASQAPESGAERKESQIVYELASGFQVEEVRARAESGARRMNLVGMISWGCIGAGIVVVVVVVISGSRRHTGSGGVKRTRYRRKAEAETRARRYMDDNRYRKY